MQMKTILSAAALMAFGAIPALGASPVLGRITYIYPDGHHLILDGQKDYELASSVDASRLGVAEFVELTVGANGVATAVRPGPANQAAYWAPRAGQS